MAEEVRQDLSGRGYAFFGRPPEPTKLQAFTAWLLVYGVYFTLYALSYAFVFRGPFAFFGPRVGVIVTVFFIGLPHVHLRSVLADRRDHRDRHLGRPVRPLTPNWLLVPITETPRRGCFLLLAYCCEYHSPN